MGAGHIESYLTHLAVKKSGISCASAGGRLKKGQNGQKRGGLQRV
jgi:hypothetical protein